MDTGFETSFVTVVVPGPGLLRAASCGLCSNPLSSDQSETGRRDGRLTSHIKIFSDKYFRTVHHQCEGLHLLMGKDYDSVSEKVFCELFIAVCLIFYGDGARL